jgi:hypothetical protein
MAIFQQGLNVILNRGQPNSFPAFHAWFQKYSNEVADNAGQKASYLLKAGDSAALDTWNNVNLAGDIDQIAMDGLGVGGPDDAAARTSVLKDAKQFRADFATAESAAGDVAAGK